MLSPQIQETALTQIIGIAEMNPDARDAFLSQIAPQVPLAATQQTTRWGHGIVELLCAAPKPAPIASTKCTSGAAAFVIGHWSGKTFGGDRSQAEQLLDACQRVGGSAVSQFATYGLACYVEPDGRLWLGVDAVGMFPLYYFADASQLLFSTSPALIAAHPDFKREFNPRGLVGSLLTMHMVGGQSLWKNLDRVKPGHALTWKPGDGSAREVSENELLPSDAHFHETHEQTDDRFDALFEQAVRDDAIEGETGTLMSGGLDSRLIAAYLRRVLRRPVQAITFGVAGDLEMRAASHVVRRLRWPHHPIDVDWSRFPEHADLHLTHQQLANGFNDLSFWNGMQVAGRYASRLFTGSLGDTVVGGMHIPWGYDPKSLQHTWPAMFKRVNRYGFPPEVIRQLVRPEVLGDTLEKTLADLREPFDSCPGLPFQKTWRFALYNRNRFHLGAMGWKIAAFTWPSITFTHRPLLEAAANTAGDAFTDRRIQEQLLIRRAPDLAALPLDHNSRTTMEPVKYRSKWHRRWDKTVTMRLLRWRRDRDIRRGIESRYYYRVYDINNPGWRAVREMAEPYRKHAETFFHPDVLRTHLPAPDVNISVKDGIVDAAKTKTLIGFMLWAGKNLA